MSSFRLLPLLALAWATACRDDRAAAPTAAPPRAPATAPAATAPAATAPASAAPARTATAAASSTTAAAARAQAVLAPFKVALRDTLIAAMAKGPEQAVEACALSAPGLATAPLGARVGRAALKLRNPANAPPAWVVGPMAELARAPREGASRVVALEGGHVGYVETIVVKPMCLACHGEAVAAPVAARLAARYPKDAATGFREGDFRGVFWADVP